MNRLEEIVNIVNKGYALKNEDCVYLLLEIKRLSEAYNQAKSEAFQLQRESWRNR